VKTTSLLLEVFEKEGSYIFSYRNILYCRHLFRILYCFEFQNILPTVISIAQKPISVFMSKAV